MQSAGRGAAPPLAQGGAYAPPPWVPPPQPPVRESLLTSRARLFSCAVMRTCEESDLEMVNRQCARLRPSCVQEGVLYPYSSKSGSLGTPPDPA